MKFKNLILLIVVFLFFPFCSEKTTQETKTSVEIIDGIVHIHNTGVPADPNTRIIFEEDLSIGGEEYDMLSRPENFTVDQDENVYIADSQDQSIKLFDSNGKYIKSTGKRGSGPGEFNSIADLALLPDGRLIVLDSVARRINVFNMMNGSIDTYQWKKSLGKLLLAANSSVIFSLYTFGGDEPLGERKFLVKEFDFRGKEIRSFGEFSQPDTKLVKEKNFALLVSPPYSPQSIFAADPKRQILYHCMNGHYMIEVYNRQGEVIRRFDRPYQPLPLTREDTEEFRKKNKKEWLIGLKIPKVKTVTSRMLVDGFGNLWVETHEKKKDAEGEFLTAYDIFDPEGYYQAKCWIQVEPEIFVKDKMYRMHRNEETGYSYVKRYRVIWK